MYKDSPGSAASSQDNRYVTNVTTTVVMEAGRKKTSQPAV